MAKNKSQNNLEKLDSSLKLLVQTSFVVFIGLFISKVLGYAYRIIIARYYGPEVYGQFTLALTIASFFISIAAFGFFEGILRYLPILRAKNKLDEIRYLVKKTRLVYLFSGIVATTLVFFLADFMAVQIFHDASLSMYIKIMSLAIFTTLLTNIHLGFLRGFEKIGSYSFLLNIFQNASRVIVLLAIVLMGLVSDGSFLVWSYVLASVITLVLSQQFCARQIGQIFGKYKKKDYSIIRISFLKYSLPVMFYSVIGLIFYWIDSFSLGYYKSAVEVGIYNAAVPIAMLLGFIPDLFLQLFFPMINREHTLKNHNLIEQLSKQVTKWIFMAGLPVFILLFFFPGAALNILFGAQYISAQDALRILLIGSFIYSVLITSNNLLSMLGKSRLIMWNMVLAAILNLVLNSILVPMQSIIGFDNSNGLIGASLATLISLVFLNILFLVQAKKYLGFLPIRKKMMTILLMGAISSVPLFYITNTFTMSIINIIITAALFVLLYGIMLLVSKSLDENDWMIIKSFLGKLRILRKNAVQSDSVQQ